MCVIEEFRTPRDSVSGVWNNYSTWQRSVSIAFFPYQFIRSIIDLQLALFFSQSVKDFIDHYRIGTSKEVSLHTQLGKSLSQDVCEDNERAYLAKALAGTGNKATS